MSSYILRLKQKKKSDLCNATVIEVLPVRPHHMITPTQTQISIQRAVLSTGYTDYGKGLLRYASTRVHDKALTEDLVQNTFLKTWAYLVKGGKVDVMEAFLFHILKALIIDEYRKHKPLSLDILLEKGFDPSLDDTRHLIDVMDGKQALALIAKLPVSYQKVMQMRYVQDLSLKEIALITGKTKNSIAVLTHRGLEKLKVLYSELAVTKELLPAVVGIAVT